MFENSAPRDFRQPLLWTTRPVWWFVTRAVLQLGARGIVVFHGIEPGGKVQQVAVVCLRLHIVAAEFEF